MPKLINVRRQTVVAVASLENVFVCLGNGEFGKVPPNIHFSLRHELR